MQKRHHHALLLLSIIFSLLNRISTNDELLELSCFDESQCHQYKQSTINVTCENHHCQCKTSDDLLVTCKPKDTKLNNIIGGPCPCHQPNAECNDVQSICYCSPDFIPSTDRRRCIQKKVTLEELCELDIQCQAIDNFAICHHDACKCMQNFIADKSGKCASIVGNNFNCTNDGECKQFDSLANCTVSHHKCICLADYVSSDNNDNCLPASDYKKSCIKDVQCQLKMGAGAECIDGICQCSKNFFPHKHFKDKGVLIESCDPIAVPGKYCRSHSDCYQHQLSEDEQSMKCNFGECNCKLGYISIDNGVCQKSSSANMYRNISIINILFICIIFSFTLTI